jgi:homopolymeric O-antigen transport system permease protein
MDKISRLLAKWPFDAETKMVFCASKNLRPLHGGYQNIMTSQEMITPRNEWDLVIRPQRPWWDLRLAELWSYRELIGLWVRREFVAFYKQTVLGPLWHIIPAIISSIVYTIVFSSVAKISTDGIPPYLFYMAGTTIWVFFSSCISITSSTFVANAGIFGKIYFPRMCIPVASIISQMIAFGVRLGVFLVFWLFFLLFGSGISPNLWILLTPVLVLIVAGLAMGFGIIISALTTKYRDLQQLLGVGLQLVMYASPIFYPLSIVPEKWRWLLLANPLTAVLEMFRFAFLGKSVLEPVYLWYSGGFMVVVLFIGFIVFNKAESNFMDTV